MMDSDEMKKAKEMHRKEAEKWELKIVEAFRDVEKCYAVSSYYMYILGMVMNGMLHYVNKKRIMQSNNW